MRRAWPRHAGRPAALCERSTGPGILEARDRVPRFARRAAALCVTFAAAAGLGGCAPASRLDVPYHDRIHAERTAKDAYFLDAPDSPVPADRRERFLPLAYFAIDESYAVPAVLAPSEREPAMEMPTSTGLRRAMRRAGTLKFTLKGQPLQLTAFVEADAPNMNRLFLPFGDMTNGTETYPAGRYLDLDRSATGLYEIDFNRAYYPYCYYNETYDCPYPPPENRLDLPVRAGERTRLMDVHASR
jgi:uncharacterized protein (DUF1684 family)